jgi:hypothetical protein
LRGGAGASGRLLDREPRLSARRILASRAVEEADLQAG